MAGMIPNKEDKYLIYGFLSIITIIILLGAWMVSDALKNKTSNALVNDTNFSFINLSINMTDKDLYTEDNTISYLTRFILLLKEKSGNFSVYSRGRIREIKTTITEESTFYYSELGYYDVSNDELIIVDFVYPDCMNVTGLNITETDKLAKECAPSEHIEFIVMTNHQFIQMLINMGVDLTDEVKQNN